MLTRDEIITKKLFNINPDLLDVKASSVDLKIDFLVSDDGKQIRDTYVLKPGEMIQAISREVFELPKNVTALVSYKTTMTRSGVWALTVGILDPGWNAPISTTLLNFGKSDYAIRPRESFLRVSFFEHKDVDEKYIRKYESVEKYREDAVKLSLEKFPTSFLDVETISRKSFEYTRNKVWQILVSASVFVSLVLVVTTALMDVKSYAFSSFSEVGEIKEELEYLRRRVDKLSETPR